MGIRIKLKYFQLTFLTLLVLLFQLKACSCNSQNDINHPNVSVNLQQPTVNNFLLSIQLKDKRFQDIFTKKEIQELNLVADAPIILEQDDEESIYQIRGINQKGGTCGYHAIRNCIWLMKALDEDPKKFNEYYFSMLNVKIYEAFQQSM